MLASSYRDITDLKTFVRQIMAIPFLPSDLIHPTYSLLQIPTIPEIEKLKLDNFLKYFKRFWLTQVKPSELSILELENGTNNGAESYHAHLKAYSNQVTRKYGNLWRQLITQLKIMTIKSLDWNKGETLLGQGKNT